MSKTLTRYEDQQIANEMDIDKLLRKLSVGDMVATEAKYHRTSLIKFYNSYREN